MKLVKESLNENTINFNDIFENYHYKLMGGKGAHLTPKDVDKNQLIVGIYVEMEHTNDFMISAAIALDHLAEKPDYYTILVKSGLVDEKDALEAAHKLLDI